MNIVFLKFKKNLKNTLLLCFSLILLTGYFSPANADFFTNKTVYQTGVKSKVESYRGKNEGTYDYETGSWFSIESETVTVEKDDEGKVVKIHAQLDMDIL